MKIRLCDTLFWRVLACVLWLGFGWRTQANPAGMTRQNGWGRGATVRADASSETDQAVASSDLGDDNGKKKANKEVALAQKASLAIVILPAKRSSSRNSHQNQTSTQPL
jgi:hypothetical protein